MIVLEFVLGIVGGIFIGGVLLGARLMSLWDIWRDKELHRKKGDG